MRTRRPRVRLPLPLLLRPVITGACNRYFPGNRLSLRESLSTVMTIAMMCGVYICVSQMLAQWNHAVGTQPQLIAPVASALLSGLFVIALLSASVCSLSSLYGSADLDFILSSPITPRRHLIGKTCEITLNTSWMFFVFGAPLYLSLGNSLGGSALYFLLAPIVGFAFLTPAILLGEMVAIVFAALLPADYGKWLFAGLFVIALFSFFSILSSEPKAPGYLPSGSLQASASLLLHYQSAPAQWAGFSIEALLQGKLGPTLPTIATSLAVSLLVWSCVVALFNTLFTRTVSMLQTKRSPWHFESRRRGIFSDIFLATTNQTRRALVTKEFFSFSREATHTVQLLLLLTICVLYLYNFSRIEPPTRVGPEVLRVWDIFLILANLGLGSMVLLSICSRFVFPSISLEGGAFWILQTAPLSVRHILRAKYFAWCIPTTLFSLVIFTSGGCALGLEPILIATTTVAGTIICHGLVALGIGMGARFARFDWTHSAQLTTNSGSFLYMLMGMLLVAINLLPLTVVFGGYILLPGVFRDHSATLVLFASGIGALLLINVITGYIALRIGARALRVQ